jgi:hypothetical protein
LPFALAFGAAFAGAAAVFDAAAFAAGLGAAAAFFGVAMVFAPSLGLSILYRSSDSAVDNKW